MTPTKAITLPPHSQITRWALGILVMLFVVLLGILNGHTTLVGHKPMVERVDGVKADVAEIKEEVKELRKESKVDSREVNKKLDRLLERD